MRRTEGSAERTAAEEEPRSRLLRLAASCPECGTRPALRMTEDEVRVHAADPPQKRIGTYPCHRRQCGMIFEITAAAYQNAS